MAGSWLVHIVTWSMTWGTNWLVWWLSQWESSHFNPKHQDLEALEGLRGRGILPRTTSSQAAKKIGASNPIEWAAG